MKNSRRSVRLRGYDYSWAGAYFVTICAQNRACLFGEISDGQAVLNDAGMMIQTVWNELIIRFPNLKLDECIVMPNHVHGILVLHRRGDPCDRPDIGPDVDPDMKGEHKVRPYIGNKSRIVSKSGGHEHNTQQGDHKDRPYARPGVRPYGTSPGTVGRIVQAFKSITTREYIKGVKQYGWRRFNAKLWQRNYYEHIIRNDDEMNRVREYIFKNPARWELDRENPNARPNARAKDFSPKQRNQS